MYGDDGRDPNVMYYLTVYNEPILQPAEPENLDVDGVLRGIYLLSPADGEGPRAQILTSGVDAARGACSGGCHWAMPSPMASPLMFDTRRMASPSARASPVLSRSAAVARRRIAPSWSCSIERRASSINGYQAFGFPENSSANAQTARSACRARAVGSSEAASGSSSLCGAVACRRTISA